MFNVTIILTFFIPQFGRYGRKAGRHDSELIAFFASRPANSGNEPYHEVHLLV
jgi:hypothetical protein